MRLCLNDRASFPADFPTVKSDAMLAILRIVSLRQTECARSGETTEATRNEIGRSRMSAHCVGAAQAMQSDSPSVSEPPVINRSLPNVLLVARQITADRVHRQPENSSIPGLLYQYANADDMSTSFICKSISKYANILLRRSALHDDVPSGPKGFHVECLPCKSGIVAMSEMDGARMTPGRRHALHPPAGSPHAIRVCAKGTHAGHCRHSTYAIRTIDSAARQAPRRSSPAGNESR